MARLALDIFYQHTKFGDSRISRSGDKIVGVKIENASCDPDTPLLEVFCHPKANI